MTPTLTLPSLSRSFTSFFRRRVPPQQATTSVHAGAPSIQSQAIKNFVGNNWDDSLTERDNLINTLLTATNLEERGELELVDFNFRFSSGWAVKVPRNVHLVRCTIDQGILIFRRGDVTAIERAIACADGPEAVARAGSAQATAYANKVGAFAVAMVSEAHAYATVAEAYAFGEATGAHVHAIAGAFAHDSNVDGVIFHHLQSDDPQNVDPNTDTSVGSTGTINDSEPSYRGGEQAAPFAAAQDSLSAQPGISSPIQSTGAQRTTINPAEQAAEYERPSASAVVGVVGDRPDQTSSSSSVNITRAPGVNRVGAPKWIDRTFLRWYLKAGQIIPGGIDGKKIEATENFGCFKSMLERLLDKECEGHIAPSEVVELIEIILHHENVRKNVFDAARSAEANCHERPLSLFYDALCIAQIGKRINEGADPKEIYACAKVKFNLDLIDEICAAVMQKQFVEKRRYGVVSIENGIKKVRFNSAEALEVQMGLRYALREFLSLPFVVNPLFLQHSGLINADVQYAIQLCMKVTERQQAAGLIQQVGWRGYMENRCKTAIDKINTHFQNLMERLDSRQDIFDGLKKKFDECVQYLADNLMLPRANLTKARFDLDPTGIDNTCIDNFEREYKKKLQALLISHGYPIFLDVFFELKRAIDEKLIVLENEVVQIQDEIEIAIMEDRASVLRGEMDTEATIEQEFFLVKFNYLKKQTAMMFQFARQISSSEYVKATNALRDRREKEIDAILLKGTRKLIGMVSNAR